MDMFNFLNNGLLLCFLHCKKNNQEENEKD